VNLRSAHRKREREHYFPSSCASRLLGEDIVNNLHGFATAATKVVEVPKTRADQQPPPAELLRSFDKECQVPYRGEIYPIRDNRSVFRRARLEARR
jgi:hypothetical protein